MGSPSGNTRNLFGPLQQGSLTYITITGSFTDGAGTAARDAAASSPDTLIGNAASGVCAVTFPAGAAVSGFSCFLEPPAGALTAGGQAVIGIPRGVLPNSGTLSVAMTDGAGTPEAPTSGTKFYISFWLHR